MKLSKREDELFDRWSQHRPSLVRDGAPDEGRFRGHAPSILFVLKEVNGVTDPGWDLREFLRKGARAETWDVVARWVHGIRTLPADLAWQAVAHSDELLRRERLSTIAAFNVKKTSGGHTTVGSQLRRICREDSDFIKEQFALYEADLVVCCGSSVARVLARAHSWAKPKTWLTTTRGVPYLEYATGKFIVAYAHPEVRAAENLLYFGLIDAVRELLHGRSAQGGSHRRAATIAHGHTASGQTLAAVCAAPGLVPQAPNDEPASVLLERIREQRAAEEASPSRPRGRRPRAAPRAEAASAQPDKPADAVVADTLDLVVAALVERGKLTSEEARAATGLSPQDLRSVFKSLAAAGKVRVRGKARGTAYEWAG